MLALPKGEIFMKIS